MNHWRTDSWKQDGWYVTRNTCTNCGFRLESFATGATSVSLAQGQQQHEAECWQPDPRCKFVLTDGLPVLRCKLVAGHPEGPQYDWFTDYNGHVVER